MEISVKYVMIDECRPIIFISQDHVSMEAHGNITSSGKMKFADGGVVCYGHSHSIQQKYKDCPEKLSKSMPTKDDAALLEVFLGLKKDAS
jgi:hypothetical protein